MKVSIVLWNPGNRELRLFWEYKENTPNTRVVFPNTVLGEYSTLLLRYMSPLWIHIQPLHDIVSTYCPLEIGGILREPVQYKDLLRIVPFLPFYFGILCL